jgi:aryl-alcohol dehydrogenase-like predicted oxidoreductase
MEHRQLGGSGLKVAVLSLGTASFGGSNEFFKAFGGSEVSLGTRLVDICLDAGATMFDSSDVYSSGQAEEILGQGYQLHGFDALTPVEETLDALDSLVRVGKIRYIGCSNFSGWHLMKSLAMSDQRHLTRYVAHQAYYSLVGREYEWDLMPLALDQKIGTVVWSPLGWGRLTGKIRRGQPMPAVSRLNTKIARDLGPPISDRLLCRVVDAIDVIANETGKTMPQIALNWLLQRPSVATVIVGARNEDQLRDNLGAVGWTLTSDHMAALDKASTTTPVYPYWHQRGFADRNPPPV